MKGDYNQECNITSCQKPNSATWYNHSTRKYYCESCAERLNNDEFNKRDAMRLYGHDLCTEEKPTLSIYEIQIPVTSQTQADRLKQICLDWNLPIWEFEDAFKFIKGDRNYFCMCADNVNFAIYGNHWKRTEITEADFINLLKPLKNEQ